MKLFFHFLIILTSLINVSCSTIAEHFPGVYALDVQQGNIIDQDMIDQLRPNMNKRQVLFILGSPMLIDTFHPERWDYIYSEQPNGEDRLQKRITLFFDGDLLTGVQGDFKPSEFPVVKPSKETTIDVPKRQLDKTIFGQIVNFFSADDEPVYVESKTEPEQKKTVDDKQDNASSNTGEQPNQSNPENTGTSVIEPVNKESAVKQTPPEAP